MNKLFVCKSIALANYLLASECKLMRIDKDRENNNFLIFLFYKNQNLNKAMNSWKK